MGSRQVLTGLAFLPLPSFLLLQILSLKEELQINAHNQDDPAATISTPRQVCSVFCCESMLFISCFDELLCYFTIDIDIDTIDCLEASVEHSLAVLVGNLNDEIFEE